MAEATTERPGGSPESSRVPRVALALWGLSILLVVALVAGGALLRGRRAEPLPVIKQVPDFALTHHDGSTVTREDFAGAPWVADFIFTRCAAICPRMTSQMGRVAAALGPAVRIASFSVDPEHDTPEVLERYAEKHGAGEGWFFLTGETESLHTLCREGFLLAVDASPPPEAAGSDPIIHSNRFVLVDPENRIRGYYDPFVEDELQRLTDDARSLLAGR